ncbi:hypothetical protein D3C86_2033890 [compost metagenome]
MAVQMIRRVQRCHQPLMFFATDLVQGQLHTGFGAQPSEACLVQRRIIGIRLVAQLQHPQRVCAGEQGRRGANTGLLRGIQGIELPL